MPWLSSQDFVDTHETRLAAASSNEGNDEIKPVEDWFLLEGLVRFEPALGEVLEVKALLLVTNELETSSWVEGVYQT
jgi:hypothetical protein